VLTSLVEPGEPDIDLSEFPLLDLSSHEHAAPAAPAPWFTIQVAAGMLFLALVGAAGFLQFRSPAPTPVVTRVAPNAPVLAEPPAVVPVAAAEAPQAKEPVVEKAAAPASVPAAVPAATEPRPAPARSTGKPRNTARPATVAAAAPRPAARPETARPQPAAPPGPCTATMAVLGLCTLTPPPAKE
jgi:hypothetical protein